MLRPHVSSAPVALSQRAARGERGGRAGDWQFPAVEPETPRGLHQHQLFIDDVRFDRHESASLEDGLSTLRVIEAAYRSAESGAAVDLSRSRSSGG
jgi:predicted dehydrogenase